MNENKISSKKPRVINSAVNPDSVKWQVEKVLKSYVRCRSNDLLLYTTILNRYYGVDIVDDRYIVDVESVRSGAFPSMETVVRTKRKFQNRGWFVATTKEEQFKKTHKKSKGHVSALAVVKFRKAKKDS